MIRIRYEEYYNDYRRTHHRKTFENLDEVADWIFMQMKTNYSDKQKGWLYMSFPILTASCITFKPEHGKAAYWIHEISDERGILLTDGIYTAGKKHISKEVVEWSEKCKKRQYDPQFIFVN